MKLQQSLDKILESKSAFAEGFYDRLKEEQPEVFRHLEGVDMKHQTNLLTTALILIGKEYEQPNDAVKFYLRLLGTRHSRKGIDKPSYTDWKETMLRTLASFHATDWDDDLAGLWGEAIDIAIDQMFIGYDEPQHV